MIEIIGDYLEEAKWHYDVLVCTTNQTVKANGELVMGAGIAKVFANRFPNIAKNWGNRIKKGHLGILATYSIPKHAQEDYLIALPTKHHWKDPSPMPLVEMMCCQLFALANMMDFRKILMTRPGCGNGGLKWEEVKEKISFLDDRFVVINMV